VHAHIFTPLGYIILWEDEKGYTVSYVTRNGRGTGGTRTAKDGWAEFLEKAEWVRPFKVNNN